jgi:hypothetical protein
MTEEEWLAAAAAEPLLNFLKGQCGDRKLRLFGAACCRRLWELLPEGFRAAVVAGERFADQEIDLKQLAALSERGLKAPGRLPVALVPFAWEKAVEAVKQVSRPPSAAGTWGRIRITARAAVEVAAHSPPWADAPISDRLETCDRLRAGEKAAQAALLRDVFGNPFRPVVLDPDVLAWNGGLTVRLARAIDDERAFDRLPVLADALEEAGCTTTALLDHLRGPGPHAKGCWGLDIILAKDR